MNRGARCFVPGPVDKSLGEFWSDNPWDIVAEGHNLSAYERNRTFVNLHGKGFLDVSFLSGTDSDGDGRSVLACDFRNNGRLDLVVRQVGGGPFLLFENDLPQQHSLEVSLRGTSSNRLGIGARLSALVNGQTLIRELFPANTFASQAPALVHFGLGQANNIDRLTIRWPSGKVQVLTDLRADRHIVVEEGKEGPAAVEAITPGQTFRP